MSIDKINVNGVLYDIEDKEGVEALRKSLVSEIARAEKKEYALQEAVGSTNAALLDTEIRLVNSVGAEELRAQEAEEVLQGNINVEVAARQAGDKALQEGLASEIARAQAAEQALQANIDNLDSTLQGVEADLGAAISAEERRAQEAEGVLQGNINVEIATRQAGDKALQDALASEIARAQEAEQALRGNINDLDSTLQGVEADLGAAISAEERRAQATELELREEIVRIRAELISAISAEAERAQAAEQKLQQYIDEAVSPYITFSDAEVERICLANFDSDADGEISKEDAAAVTDLGTVFNGNTVIESFNELRQFKRVKALKSLAFSGCSQLESIDLSNIEIFNSDAFNGSFKDCASLTNIGSLSKVKSLDNQGFHGCTSLENIGTLDNLETIGRYCFRNTAIKSVIAPKLQGVAVPSDGVQSQFANCSQLETVYIPMMKVIYSTMFDNCSNLKEIVFSNELTEIKSYGLNTNSDFITKIELPATCETLGYQSLANNRNLETLIVRATTPPTLGDQAFYYRKPNTLWGIIENLTIYVPDASVDAYKSATNWVNYASRIKPLSEYVEQ